LIIIKAIFNELFSLKSRIYTIVIIILLLLERGACYKQVPGHLLIDGCLCEVKPRCSNQLSWWKYGCKKELGGKAHNQELHILCSSPNIIREIKYSVKWAKCAVRIWKCKLATKWLGKLRKEFDIERQTYEKLYMP
jgi:hypothetical protein